MYPYLLPPDRSDPTERRHFRHSSKRTQHVKKCRKSIDEQTDNNLLMGETWFILGLHYVKVKNLLSQFAITV
jgi:hypothetical protein